MALPNFDPAEDWRTRGCTIAGKRSGEWCGEMLHGAVLVCTYPVPIDLGIDLPPTEGAVLVCRRHFAALTGAPSQGGAQ